jgi:hypothetical protein
MATHVSAEESENKLEEASRLFVDILQDPEKRQMREVVDTAKYVFVVTLVEYAVNAFDEYAKAAADNLRAEELRSKNDRKWHRGSLILGAIFAVTTIVFAALTWHATDRQARAADVQIALMREQLAADHRK